VHAAINPYIVACHDDIPCDSGFNYVDHVDSAGLLAYPVHENFVYANVPLQDILPHVSLRMGFKIAQLHHIYVGSHVTKSDFICYFDSHSCASCNLYSSVFSIVQSSAVKDKNCKHASRLNLNQSAPLNNVGRV
jgi:hypothetical protein